MSAGLPEQLEDQRERTLLAWRRTALSLVAVGLLVAHLSVGDSPVGLLALLVVVGSVVAFVWLNPGVRPAVSAAALSLGVLALGSVALVALLGGWSG